MADANDVLMLALREVSAHTKSIYLGLPRGQCIEEADALEPELSY